MPIAISSRTLELKVEEAFKVSEEAAAHESETGRKVYKFHLGDLEDPTPDNIIETLKKALDDGKTHYCPPAGIPEFRKAVAEHLNETRRTDYSADNICVQIGGKLGVFNSLLLTVDPGDTVFNSAPSYPAYSPVANFLGGSVVRYPISDTGDRFEFGFDSEFGFESIDRLMRNAKRPKFILNDHNNPTGTKASKEGLSKVAWLVNRYGAVIITDEAYFRTNYGPEESISIANPEFGVQDNIILVGTLSKDYSATGFRLGYIAAPKEVIEYVKNLTIDTVSCVPPFIQEAGIEALRGDQSGAQAILKRLERKRDLTHDKLSGIRGFKVYKSPTTFFSYPDVTDAVYGTGCKTVEEFRIRVLDEADISFCTMDHFDNKVEPPYERGQRLYARFSYGSISEDNIVDGLNQFNRWIEKSWIK